MNHTIIEFWWTLFSISVTLALFCLLLCVCIVFITLWTNRKVFQAILVKDIEDYLTKGLGDLSEEEEKAE